MKRRRDPQVEEDIERLWQHLQTGASERERKMWQTIVENERGRRPWWRVRRYVGLRPRVRVPGQAAPDHPLDRPPRQVLDSPDAATSVTLFRGQFVFEGLSRPAGFVGFDLNAHFERQPSGCDDEELGHAVERGLAAWRAGDPPEPRPPGEYAETRLKRAGASSWRELNRDSLGVLVARDAVRTRLYPWRTIIGSEGKSLLDSTVELTTPSAAELGRGLRRAFADAREASSPEGQEDIGLEGFFVASDEQITPKLVETGPGGRLPRIECRNMTPIEVATLGQILGAGGYEHLNDAMTETLQATPDGGSGLFRVEPAIQAKLASLVDVDGAAAQWVLTDELKNASAGAAAEILSDVRTLARRAEGDGKGLWVWWSL